MSAEDRLRRYLEQRRELGESELVLDGMSVEEVMRIIGALGVGRASPAGSAASPNRTSANRAPSTSVHRESERQVDERERGDADIPATADWREALRAVGADKTSLRDSRASPPERPAIEAPQGIVVGERLDDEPVPEIAACQTLEEVAAMVARCRRCDLYKTALNPVPGEGNPNARLMCIGEAPGAREDETGRPFVGAAGELLTKILAAINLKRDEVFIANVLKHRPPGNRNPLPQEVAACSPYLVRQVALIRPEVIITFGAFAAQTLLETKLAIGKLRGAVHRYHGIPVVVTYHPAALLRNPAWKRPTWEDVQLARRILDNSSA